MRLANFIHIIEAARPKSEWWRLSMYDIWSDVRWTMERSMDVEHNLASQIRVMRKRFRMVVSRNGHT